MSRFTVPHLELSQEGRALVCTLASNATTARIVRDMEFIIDVDRSREFVGIEILNFLGHTGPNALHRFQRKTTRRPCLSYDSEADAFTVSLFTPTADRIPTDTYSLVGFAELDENGELVRLTTIVEPPLEFAYRASPNDPASPLLHFSSSDPPLNAYLAGVAAPRTREELVEWVWGLAPFFGKHPLVVAALAAAQSVSALWQRGAPADPFWQERYANHATLAAALSAAAGWTSCPCDRHLEDARTTSAAASGLVEAMFHDEEGLSGEGRVLTDRRRSLAAASAASLCAAVAAWTPDSIPVGLDERERAARIAAGPANEAAQAVAASYQAGELDAHELFLVIRRSLQQSRSW